MLCNLYCKMIYICTRTFKQFMKRENKIPVAFRFPPALKKKIETLARLDKRSNNSLVEKVMNDYCNKKLKRINPETND